MSTTARRAAGGAVVGVSTTVTPPPPAPGALPALDPEVLRELFAQYLREAGLDIDPGQIQGLVAQYQSIAARANALLNSAAANPSLIGGAPSSLDPNQILNFLANQLGAAFVPKALAPGAPVAKAPAPAPAAQPAAPAPAPGSGAAVEGGKGDMAQMEPDLEMDLDMNMDMRMNMDMD
jgi:hypothetical protein